MSMEMGYSPQLVVLIFVCVFDTVRAQLEPIVSTNLGAVRGSILKTERGVEFNAFRGIRYAEAPIREKRFKAPVAVTKWNGEYDATKDGFMCPQMGKRVDLLSEDCLILNVYTRTLTGSKAVLVYIHGGGYIYGGSHSVHAAGPEYFMESGDIVLVSMNYRLGSLGFLSTKSKEAPGNYGYLDQLMAIQWVHNHISSFGGNPNSVTLIGVSAGAMAVTLHMASPLSQGLFHRAIALSGSSTSEVRVDNLFWTRQLAHEASCPRFNPEDVLSCLRKVPWQKIVEINQSWQMYGFLDLKYNYEIDGYFLKTTPTQSFAKGNFNKVPIITGMTKDEMIFMVYKYENDTAFFNDIYFNLEKYAQEFFLHNFEDPKIKKVEVIKSFYLGNKTINEQNITNFGEIFSDSIINHGVHRLVELARKHVDVYLYRFDYLGSMGTFKNTEGKLKGVSHADDFQYIIKRNRFGKPVNLSSPDWFMVERMVGIFTSFAQNGFPHNVDGVKWEPSNKTEVHTLYIDRGVELGIEPFIERFRLWDSLFPVSKGSGAMVCVKNLRILLTSVLSIFVNN